MQNGSMYETSVSPQNLKEQKTLYVIFSIAKWLCLCACIILFVYVIHSLDFYAIITLVILILLTLLLWLIQLSVYCFYDYTYISGEIRITKVLNNKKRRSFITFDCKNILLIFDYESEEYYKYINLSKYKILNAAPTRNNEQIIYLLLETPSGDFIVKMIYNVELLTRILKHVGSKKLNSSLIEKIKNG